MKKNKYEIRNETEDTAELLLYGIIGDYWDDNDAKEIVKDIRALDVKNIIVHIYSDGGSVNAGLAIYNTLKAHPANITVIIDSLAASIASVIAMSGTVEMPENAFMMIHNPWGLAIGDASEMQKTAELLSKYKSSLIKAYQGKTGLEEEKISGMMDEETWLMAEEAVELGFADSVIGAVEADPKNMLIFNSLEKFKNVPAEIKALLNNQSGALPEKKGGSVMPKETKETPAVVTLDSLRAEHPDIVETILAEGRKEGAEAERDRIKAVSEQSMPGHEALIEGLMYDGETTGPEAAVKVLQAERKIRDDFNNKLDKDKIDPVDHDPPPDTKTVEIDETLPVEERAKATWDKDKSIRSEFDGDYSVFLAYFKANDKGQVRLLKNKEGK